MVRKMAEVLGLNLITIDCSTLCAEGWKGIGLSQRLLSSQKELKDQNTFARSILFFDEIDKLRLWDNAKDQGNAMNNILQLFNSGSVTAEESGTKTVSIDIKRFTVLFGGAFEGLDKIICNRLSVKKEIGFGRMDTQIQSSSAVRLQEVTKEDLIAYGMLPELLGRIGTILTIPSLTKEDYRKLLAGGKGSIHYQYQNYLRGLYGISFALTDAAVNWFAEVCLTSGSGARAVMPVVNDRMREALSAIEEDRTINRVLLDADAQGVCIRYGFGERAYCFRSSDTESLLVHWIKGKSCKALTEKLCRYYRKANGDPGFLPTLSLFLECALEYLKGGRKEDFCFSSLEKLARTVQRDSRGSQFDRLTCGCNQEIIRSFRKAYKVSTQRDLVIALQRIMEYLEHYHKKTEVRFILKRHHTGGIK